MTDVKTLKTENLRALIAQTKASLAAFEEELERREDQAQHDEIDHLEDHFTKAELSLKTIVDFLGYVVAEVRSKGKISS